MTESNELLLDTAVAPIVLVRADDPDRKPALYACGKCGSLHSPRMYLASAEVSDEAARKAASDCYHCRTHSVCEDCGDKCENAWTACAACRSKRTFERAVEVPDTGGPYCLFDGETYYRELAEAQDDGAEWVSPCDVSFPTIDADSVLDDLLGDMYEDADVDALEGVEAFSAAVAAFNQAQTWTPDSKRKIRVPARQQGAAA